ncbi:MAG: hypothetical protein ACFFA0_06335 [Promethearchaeota archaeon]
MLSKDLEDIGIKQKRVLLEPENVREIVKLLKTQKGLSQRVISEYIGYYIGDVLNSGYSLPYENFTKLQTLALRVQKTLHFKEIKCRRTYNKQSMEKLARIIGIKKTGVGGKFLSEKYKGINISHRWQCGKCGKVWKNSPNAIIYREQWCIRCQGRETWTYEQMIELAKKRGLEKNGVEGMFLTSKDDYESRSHPDMSKYYWECGKCGFTWEATANNIKRGSWCRKCQYTQLSRKNRTPYNKILALAKKIGIIKTGYAGVLLAGEKEYNKIRYPTNHKFQWKCGKCNNIFEMDISHVRRPQWCPSCTEGESEMVCRGFFERIFKVKFPKTRPKWLVSPLSGGQMHLDGYNKKLKLGFEFNGPQHYMFYPKYHRKYEDFVKQQELDRIKAELCKKMGIVLIIVPHNLDYDEFQDYIIEVYRKLTGKEVKNKIKYNWKTFKREDLGISEFL